MRRRQAQCAHVHTLSASAATTSASAGSGDRARRSAVAPAAPRYSDDGVEGRAAGARIRYLWCVLLAFVVAYLLVTIALGLWAAKRVKNTADFAVAGRHLPLVMIITTTFATWFGSEAALGVVFSVLSGRTISRGVVMFIGAVSILVYTLFGCMWSVAVTDFVQMII